MLHAFSRSEGLIGKEGLEILADSKVAVFGLGGVGSYVVEALARAGVGNLILVDHDEVAVTNLNRQLVALRSTIGRKKVQVAKERIADINEDAVVHTYETFFSAETASLFDFSGYDHSDLVTLFQDPSLRRQACKPVTYPVWEPVINWIRPAFRADIAAILPSGKGHAHRTEKEKNKKG